MAGRASYHPVMKTSGITAALPVLDLGIQVTDVRAAVEEMRGRGVEFEEYDTPETRTGNGVARMPGGGEAAWFKDSEGNLVGVVPA